MDIHDVIRGRIRERLEDLGLPLTGKTYTDVGIGGTTVRNFLDGSSESMTLRTVEKLAPILKVSPQWLLYGETAEILGFWSQVPDNRRKQAKAVLETFRGGPKGRIGLIVSANRLLQCRVYDLW